MAKIIQVVVDKSIIDLEKLCSITSFRKFWIQYCSYFRPSKYN